MKNIEELEIEKKKYIIFDVDGTMIDSLSLYALTDQIFIKEYGGVTLSFSKIREDADNFFRQASKEKNMYLAYMKFLSDKYNMSTLNSDELLQIREALAEKLMREKLELKGGVIETLSLLKKMGYKLIIATMTPRYSLDNAFKNNQNIRKLIDIDYMFDLILTQENVVHKKPDPEVFLKVLDYFNASTEECLIFEDSLTGVLAANSADIEVVNVFDLYSKKEREKLNERADYFIQSFDDFNTFLNQKLNTEQKKFIFTKKRTNYEIK